MKICIVGLGLIGGSLAKAIKKNTHESCFGIDIDRGTIAGALAQEAIDGEMAIDDLAGCDVVIVGLHPEATIKFITENADKFKKGGIV
ncbi:NAD(P)-binding domain-containing protein, partial [Ruminococcus bicirculans (ex Wegman et al. 2014)]